MGNLSLVSSIFDLYSGVVGNLGEGVAVFRSMFFNKPSVELSGG